MNVLTRKCGDFRTEGQKFRVVKYADGLVLHRNQRVVLEGSTDRLIEIARWYGMEVSVQKTKVMRISREPSRLQILIDKKQLKNVECLHYG